MGLALLAFVSIGGLLDGQRLGQLKPEPVLVAEPLLKKWIVERMPDAPDSQGHVYRRDLLEKIGLEAAFDHIDETLLDKGWRVTMPPSYGIDDGLAAFERGDGARISLCSGVFLGGKVELDEYEPPGPAKVFPARPHVRDPLLLKSRAGPRGMYDLLKDIVASRLNRDTGAAAFDPMAQPIDSQALTQCLARYQAYGLQLPPTDATFKYVVAEEGRYAGFFVNWLPEGSESLVGDEGVVGPNPEEDVPMRPQAIDALPLYLTWHGTDVETGIPTALQLFKRGQTDLAARLFERALTDAYTHKGTLADIPPNTSPVTAISYIALGYYLDGYINYFPVATAGATPIPQRIKQIYATETSPAFHEKDCILTQLDAALHATKHEESSPEGVIDTAVVSRAILMTAGGRTADGGALRYFGRCAQIIDKGVLFTPYLFDHLDDARLTTATQRESDGTVHLCTVGDVCLLILKGFMDTDHSVTKQSFDDWYRRTTAAYGGRTFMSWNDIDYAYETLSKDAEPSGVLLQLLRNRAPDRLKELQRNYEKIGNVRAAQIISHVIATGLADG